MEVYFEILGMQGPINTGSEVIFTVALKSGETNFGEIENGILSVSFRDLELAKKFQDEPRWKLVPIKDN